jgi:hypothetical protein
MLQSFSFVYADALVASADIVLSSGATIIEVGVLGVLVGRCVRVDFGGRSVRFQRRKIPHQSSRSVGHGQR